MRIVIQHKGSNHLEGLFAYLRKESFINFVKLTGPEALSGGYCGKDNLQAVPLNNLIDGNDSTVWSNNKFGDEYAYFIIDMMMNRLKMSGISFSIPCNNPPYLYIEGSFDNNKYHKVRNITGFINYETKYFSCKSAAAYRYYKVSGPSRLHLSDVEVFGVLNPINQTCKKNRYFAYFTLYALLL